MSCVSGFTQQVCLTLVVNLATNEVVSSEVDCVLGGGTCEESVAYDPGSNTLTFTVPFTASVALTVNNDLTVDADITVTPS